MLRDRYPWPVAQMNAVTIRSFHSMFPPGVEAHRKALAAAARKAKRGGKGSKGGSSGSLTLGFNDNATDAARARASPTKQLGGGGGGGDAAAESEALPASAACGGGGDAAAVARSLRLFKVFFAVALPWYLVTNASLQFMITFPVLCWVCRTQARIFHTLLCAVGVGFADDIGNSFFVF